MVEWSNLGEYGVHGIRDDNQDSPWQIYRLEKKVGMHASDTSADKLALVYMVWTIHISSSDIQLGKYIGWVSTAFWRGVLREYTTSPSILMYPTYDYPPV